jgi:NADH:ubiquinone oxidoreductase subunit H
MRYVIAGYVFVLALLALYAVALVWRRRRLTQAVARVTGPAAAAAPPSSTGPVQPGPS